MAYDTVAQAAPAGATTSPNEVAIWLYFSSDTVIYTVPAGKIFKGWILPYNTSTSPDYTYTPSAASILLNAWMGNTAGTANELNATFYHTSTGHDAKWPIMMNAGDKFKRRSSHTLTLMGLETTVNTVSWDTSS